MLLRQRSWIIALFHVALVALSFLFAWLLRFDFKFTSPRLMVACLPLLVLSRLGALAIFKLVHGYWNHSGVTDVVDIIKAIGLGTVAFAISVQFVIGSHAFPFSIYLMEAMTTAGALTGVRLSALAFRNTRSVSRRQDQSYRVVVVGAGDAAGSLIRQIRHSEFIPVACVDDDAFKHGAKIHGVPVVNTIDRLSVVVSAYDAQEIFIAIPSATGPQMQRISKLCEQTGLRYRTVPKLEDLLLGRVAVSQLREVNIEDLLGRDSVRLDNEVVRERIVGKVILVTGAAGSIGSELCRQILRHSPAKLIALDQAETPMFYLQLQLTKQPFGDRVVYAVADVADTSRMRRILADGAVDTIFHAAAYKHVSLVENNIRAALNNNVLGLAPLLDVAEECGCEAFVLISSDKAVQPTSFMGATKRLGELILAARPKKNMRCVSVRFGNVLGSQGSVIPVLKEQIEKEGRITITHPDITRFFMTIPEAVSLVLQAFTLGEHGDILVLDMGNPVRILDLAHSLIRQCGKSSSEIKIEFTGLRQGEKMYEDLFYPRERKFGTTNRKVKRTKSEIIAWPSLSGHLEDLISLVNSGTEISIRAKMKEIIPEYSYETETMHVATEPVADVPPIIDLPSSLNVPSPIMGSSRAFAAGAGQD